MKTLAASPDNIARAAAHLRGGGLVAFPTETVYGLGADATNALAVASVFDVKSRPLFNPLIVHVPDLAQAEKLAEFSPGAYSLAEKFWPGALTLVLPRRAGSGVADLVPAGLGTIALRAPRHPLAQALLRESGCPIAAPSANRSGGISPTLAQHVEEDFAGEEGLILDGGPSEVGLESTVVGWNGKRPVLLRSGALTREELEQALGARLDQAGSAEAPVSPGQLESHYAPRASLRLDAQEAKDGEALLGFGPDIVGAHYNLSPAGDLIEAAANLYAALRLLDATGVRTIAVAPIPDRGLGEAINDRLRRAAAPRR